MKRTVTVKDRVAFEEDIVTSEPDLERRLETIDPTDDGLTMCLVSADRQLLKLCQEAIQELGWARCDIALLEAAPAGSISADLVIWDVDSAVWPPPFSLLVNSPCQENLFVVGRKHLQKFLTGEPFIAGSTVLKPVSLRTMQIFFEQTLARVRVRKQRPGAEDTGSSNASAKDLLQCLLMANLKLQEYDHDRTNFLSRAVHDFRAPLMAASGYCSLLLEQALGPLNPNQADLVGRIRHSVEKLTRMAAGMLQLSVGQHTLRVPNLREASLEACIANALHEVESLAREKHITVSVKLRDPHEPLVFEPEQIEEVMVNLLENACKFTPKGGFIEIRGYPACPPGPANQRASSRACVEVEDSSSSAIAYRVDVSDTGPGILCEHLEEVFEEYTSYGGSQDRSGEGLGLAICKMIVTSHQGQIWAENLAGGARLSFILPLGKFQAQKPVDASKGRFRLTQAAS